MDELVRLLKEGYICVISADSHVTISDGFHEGNHGLVSVCDPEFGRRRVFDVEAKKKQHAKLVFYIKVEPIRQEL